jgi:hypothetical protein
MIANRHINFCILKSVIILLLLSQKPSKVFAQTITQLVDDSAILVKYNIKEGRLTGSYTSFYKNGKQKSSGQLQNGYRIGNWKVWDSTGRLRMERNYTSILEFKRLIPPADTSGPIPLLINHPYAIKYNGSHYIELFKMKAEFAIFRHKLWRNLDTSNNKELFDNNRLYKTITRALLQKTQVAFDVTDDRFTKELSFQQMEQLVLSNATIAGFKIKEEFIFDMERLVSEYRILGICPQVKVNDTIQDLFWIYYPDFRKTFAIEKTRFASLSFIKTLDDLFFYRDFSSVITKTTVDNPYDLWLKDYPGLTPALYLLKQKTAELEIIEKENDLWIWCTN